MNSELNIAEIELKNKQKQIKLGDALESLQKSRAFKFLIEEYYLVDRVLNTVKKLSDPCLTESMKEQNIMELESISFFSRFLDECVYNAKLAKDTLTDAENTVTEILEESL